MTPVAAVLALHGQLVYRLEGVIESDGTVTAADEAESILSTQALCSECRKPWPCPTAELLSHQDRP